MRNRNFHTYVHGRTTIAIYINVVIIAQGELFMVVNRPEAEGVARGQGWFAMQTSHGIVQCH
jgi:hypothetical protein